MVSVRVIHRTGGPAFYAMVRTTDGRRLQRKLGRAWLRRSRPPTGYLTRAQAEARLGEILSGRDDAVAIIPGPGSEITFKTATDEFLRYVELDRKRRPSTVSDYRQEIRQLLKEFGESTPLAEITTERIDRWRVRMVAENRLTARTINKRRQQLHAIFNRARKRYGLPSNPVAAVERQPDRPSGDFNVLDPTEIELVADNAANEQDAAVFRVAAYTGLRVTEPRALRWEDIDWMARVIHVRRSYSHRVEGAPKSGKVRSVPLIARAARALDDLSRRERWTDDDDFVFVNPVGGVIEDSALRRRFYEALDRAGLGYLRKKRMSIRFHDLRHTFGTLAVQAWPVTDVKAFMGQADLQTTMRYVHHVPQHDAADRLERVVEARIAAVGCTSGAREEEDEECDTSETASEREVSDGPGRIRTSDQRIMSPLL